MTASETYAEVQRRLHAAPQRVFAAFADTRLVSRWLSPPDGARSERLIRHEKLARIDAVRRHAAGWQGARDRLTAVLELPGAHRGDAA